MSLDQLLIGNSCIGISIFFLGLVLWGGWNVYQGRLKSFNEGNIASNNLVNQCMKQLPLGSSVCDQELRLTLQRSCDNSFSNFNDEKTGHLR